MLKLGHFEAGDMIIAKVDAGRLGG